MSEPIIRIENVSFAYSVTKALAGLSLNVEKGSVMGLLGANGAGKTTLMHLLNGLMPPRSGRVRVLGLDPWRERELLQHRLAFVPEQPNAYPWMRVRSYLDFYRRNFPGWDQDAVAGRLHELNIPFHRRIGDLSRGQRGIVSLMAALGRHGDVLLLDDPTLGLDVLARRQLYRTIVEELAEREVTVLFTTHLPAEVEGVLTHAAFIRDGTVAGRGTIEDLKRAHAGPAGAPSLEELSIHYMGGSDAA